MESVAPPAHLRRGHMNPNEAAKRLTTGGSRSMMPVAGLAFLRELTREIHAAKTSIDSSTDKSPTGDVLAALYVQRAATLLEYADYDASVLVPDESVAISIGDLSEPSSQQQTEDDSKRAEHMIPAVKKAAEDAHSAIALAPGRVEGYFIAAQCARSSGGLEEAMEMAGLAVERLPGNPQVAQLAKEIAIERANSDESTQTRLPLVTTTTEAFLESMESALERVSIGKDDPEERQNENAEDNNDEGQDSNHRGIWRQIAVDLDQLRSISYSSSLARMEHLMHHNVHHKCASTEDARELEHALKTVLSTLLLLVRSCDVLGLNVDSRPFEDILKSKLERVDWYHLLVQDRAARKWITHSLAPVTRITPTIFQGSDSTPAITMLWDTLVLLTRVLLAMSGWRRCTAMPHALPYAELGFDLIKELSSTANSGHSAGAIDLTALKRLEMACTDAYGIALRDLLADYGEALSLHQESLETAVLLKDRAYELRCHHLVGQALLRMKESVLAQAEFMQLLVQSQEEGDAVMEALAHFELGECCVQRGELEEAFMHLQYARTICNQTGSCSGTWRPQSIHRAIDFYSAMRPARRRDAVLCSSNVDRKSQEGSLPTRRPGLLFQESDFAKEKTLEPQHDNDACGQKSLSTLSKLFANKSAAVNPVVKQRRRGGWRDSVFTVPSSDLMGRNSQMSSCSSSYGSSSSQFSCSPSASSVSSEASCSASTTATSSDSKSSLSTVMSYSGRFANSEAARVTPVEPGKEDLY